MGTDWLGPRRFVHLAGRRRAFPFVNKKFERDDFALLDGVTDAGCTAFDTARSYNASEQTLGAWLRARQMRERVVVISKGAHPGPGWSSRLSAKEITRDLERSLKALRTDYIDLYLIHYDDDQIETGPIVDVLNRHLTAGKVRAIGVSNWRPDRIANASDYARATNQKPFVASSVQFSLASWQCPPWPNARSISGEQAEGERRWYNETTLWILAYSSLAMGFFSDSRGRARGKGPVPPHMRFGEKVFLSPENLARLERARQLARQRGVSAGQVALAWVLRYDPKVLAIVGARSAAAYVDAAGACAIELSEAERRWLFEGEQRP